MRRKTRASISGLQILSLFSHVAFAPTTITPQGWASPPISRCHSGQPLDGGGKLESTKRFPLSHRHDDDG